MDPFSIHSLTSAHLNNIAVTSNSNSQTPHSNNSSTSSSSNNEQQFETHHHHQQHHNQLQQQQQHPHQHQISNLLFDQNQNNVNQGQAATTTTTTPTTTTVSNYFNLESNSNYSNKSSPTVLVNQSIVKAKTESHQSHQQAPQVINGINMNAGSNQHNNNMIPSAHGSADQSTAHYSLQNSIKLHSNDSSSGSSGIALNFSHDLSQHQTTSHHNQQSAAGMIQQQQQQQQQQHQHSDNNSDIKPHQLSAASNHTNHHASFELDSGSLMRSAAVGMNMWKDTMGHLNHFKHPAIADHNFLPNSDLNSFSSWPHTGNNLCHQTPSMTHHILDAPHLISYQHQRSMPTLSGSDLVGASIKSQTSAEQASFMLNSINHQASSSAGASQNPSSSHQTTQPLDNHLNLRSHPLDHSASYNLSMNDNQFYNSSRSESRSHPNAIKPSFMVADRSVHMSLTNHQSQLTYHNSNELAQSLQPTTSSQQHLAGSSSAATVANTSSSSSTSKNTGSFICSTCNEVFSLRTVYQSHIKTHSQDKVSKAKFECELCGHSFSQKTSLNRHMKSHTGERPFPCEICNKAFSEKERLKIHMRTHTGEKPFSCGICGKSFSQKSTVKRHQTVHTGEKKFRCDCGKGFANRGNLIAHIKTRGSNHFE